MMKIAGAAVAVAAALACANSPSLEGASIRDSAGIQIVHNQDAGAGGAQSWNVDGLPALVLGQHSESNQAEFVGITGLVRVSGGDLVVADASRTLREYDAKGEYIGAIGREGAGPGEFRTISILGAPATDTLMVWDYALRRFTLLPLNGSQPRVFPAPGVPGFFFITDFMDDGSALGLQVPALELRDLVSGTIRPQVRVLRYAPRTGELDTIAQLSGAISFVTSGRHSMVLELPFSPGPQCVADGNLVHCGAGDQFEILTYSANGQLQRIVRLEHPPRPLPRSAITSFIDRRVGYAHSPEARAEILETYSSLPYPEDLPAFERLLVDLDRNLWVMDYALPDESLTHWHVFDSGGRLAAKVDLPRRFTMFAAGKRDILGVARDSLDVEQVQVLRLQKP